MSLLKEIIKNDVSLALKEDIQTGDVTGLLIDINQVSIAKVITRQAMVMAGKEWFNESILQLDSRAQLEWFFNDGDVVNKNQILCPIKANSRALLAGERTALNFLQLLSGIASQTQKYVKQIESETKVLDTRKTLPNLRAAQKYAVTCGGGTNHRFGLYDQFLIKENHIKACGSIELAVAKAKLQQPNLKVEVEVEDLNQLQQALDCPVDIIMLDNFSVTLIEQAMKMRGDRSIKFEASGNVSMTTIKEIANTGVDFISVGALTKSVEAVDLSLLVENIFES